jgi:hypothetical protein
MKFFFFISKNMYINNLIIKYKCKKKQNISKKAHYIHQNKNKVKLIF